MWKCARIKKYVRQVGIEVCNIPTYEGLPNLESFLTEFKEKVYEPHRLLSLDVELKGTLARCGLRIRNLSHNGINVEYGWKYDLEKSFSILVKIIQDRLMF